MRGYWGCFKERKWREHSGIEGRAEYKRNKVKGTRESQEKP